MSKANSDSHQDGSAQSDAVSTKQTDAASSQSGDQAGQQAWQNTWEQAPWVRVVPNPSYSTAQDEISLLDIYQMLKQRWRLLCGLFFAGLLIAALLIGHSTAKYEYTQNLQLPTAISIASSTGAKQPVVDVSAIRQQFAQQLKNWQVRATENPLLQKLKLIAASSTADSKEDFLTANSLQLQLIASQAQAAEARAALQRAAQFIQAQAVAQYNLWQQAQHSQLQLVQQQIQQLTTQQRQLLSVDTKTNALINLEAQTQLQLQTLQQQQLSLQWHLAHSQAWQQAAVQASPVHGRLAKPAQWLLAVLMAGLLAVVLSLGVATLSEQRRKYVAAAEAMSKA